MSEQIKSAPVILRRKAVQNRIGLSRSSIYDAIKQGTFPAPVRLGNRAVGWLSSEVDGWLAAQIEKSRGPDQSPAAPKRRRKADPASRAEQA